MYIVSWITFKQHKTCDGGAHLPKGSTSSGVLSSIWSSDVLALAGRGTGSSLNQAIQYSAATQIKKTETCIQELGDRQNETY
jgi:hypothetical protein